jgi:hypothetical protein
MIGQFSETGIIATGWRAAIAGTGSGQAASFRVKLAVILINLQESSA